MCVIDQSYESEMDLRQRATEAQSDRERDRLISAANKLEQRRLNTAKLYDMRSYKALQEEAIRQRPAPRGLYTP